MHLPFRSSTRYNVSQSESRAGRRAGDGAVRASALHSSSVLGFADERCISSLMRGDGEEPLRRVLSLFAGPQRTQVALEVNKSSYFNVL